MDKLGTTTAEVWLANLLIRKGCPRLPWELFLALQSVQETNVKKLSKAQDDLRKELKRQ